MTKPFVTDHAIEQFRARVEPVSPWTARRLIRTLACQRGQTQGIHHHTQYRDVPVVLVIRGGQVVTVWVERTGA